MKAKHTPTPWKTGKSYPRRITTLHGVMIANAILATSGKNPGKPEAEAEANAALIVRAVNHHEALVDIVRVLTQVETDDPVAHMLEYGAACERARAILAALDTTPHTQASS